MPPPGPGRWRASCSCPSCATSPAPGRPRPRSPRTTSATARCPCPADRPGTGTGLGAWEPLRDVQAGDRPPDHQPLDLRGALEDREDLGIAVPALHRVLAGVAVPAEYLDRLLGDPHRGFPRDQLGHRALRLPEGHLVA